jgi:hypothetical protein
MDIRLQNKKSVACDFHGSLNVKSNLLDLLGIKVFPQRKLMSNFWAFPSQCPPKNKIALPGGRKREKNLCHFFCVVIFEQDRTRRIDDLMQEMKSLQGLVEKQNQAFPQHQEQIKQLKDKVNTFGSDTRVAPTPLQFFKLQI